MRPWHLSALLAGAAALAAMLIPDTQPRPEGAPPELPSPARVGALRVRAALDAGALLRGSGEERFLVVSLEAPDAAGAPRQPVHLAVVADASGSMAGAGKIDYARRATRALVDQLGPSDSFSLVSFDTAAQVRQPLASVLDPRSFYPVIDELSPGGGTIIGGGLELGLAQLAGAPEGARRVVLLSDGQSGESTDYLAALAASGGRQGAAVSALGLGLDFDDRLLTAISDAGGGRYHYVSDPAELAGMLADELRLMGSIAGRRVEVEADLAEGVELLDVYGYDRYDGRITADGFSALVGDISGGQARKVVARVRVPDGALGAAPVGTIVVRYADPRGGPAYEQRFSVQAEVTDDPARVQASFDAPAAALAARALAGVALESGTLRWREGDTAGARAALGEGLARLDAWRARGLEGLEQEAAALRERSSNLDQGVELDESMEDHLRALGYVE